MCYLKNLVSEETLDFDDIFQKGEEEYSEQTETEVNVLIPCPHKYTKPAWSLEQQMLVTLFELIEKNSVLIRAMQKSLAEPSQNLENYSIQTVKAEKSNLFQSEEPVKCQDVSPSATKESLNLCTRLFGAHKYKYFLQLSEEFPKVIYKERNFNLEIKLVDENDKIVRNCNMISLCCAVSTSHAEWIHENRVGEPFMKGKTQVELYKGEAAFVKLYARDVSRVYPEGKINLVIYSKPSTLLYSGSSSYQVVINSQDVQPLIIEDLVIKAKKKQ